MQPVTDHKTREQMAERIAGMIDHTLLKPTATEEQIRTLCAEALEYRFASVCINPAWVPLCAQLLTGSPVKVCTVIGFPLGATLAAVKAYETQQTIAAGAQEVDMVINIGALKSGQDQVVQDDIAAVVNAARPAGALTKVIIETTYLTEDEKIRACRLARAVGAEFVKTSTGFGPGGATAEDVALMRRTVGPEMGIKAAGGIRTAADAQAMIAAGATRIGASAGVKIVAELKGA
jgi:deoxyribose-phosphate aldolase